jgi:tetratricopeptide (TPR) repeat protein
LGALYLQAGEDIAAERVLEQALALAPEDPRVLVNLAQVRLRRGLWSEAVEAYQKANQIAPGHGSTLYGYALALMERMQWPAALKALDEAIDVRPRFARAYAAKVVCLHAMGRLGEAEQVAKQAIDELSEKSADLHIALARVWVEQKKIEEALEQLQLAAELAPDNPATSLAYGELLDAAGQKSEAIKQYQRFLKNPARRSEDSRRIRERLKVLGAPAKG